MILNLSDHQAAALLIVVDSEANWLREELRRRRRRRLTSTEVAILTHNNIVLLQHCGIVKHRIEVNLGISMFRGPADWGYPLHGKPPRAFIDSERPPARLADHVLTLDMFPDGN